MDALYLHISATRAPVPWGPCQGSFASTKKFPSTPKYFIQGECDPRTSPFLGFSLDADQKSEHALSHIASDQLDAMFQRRPHRWQRLLAFVEEEPEDLPMKALEHDLPRKSPFVGFQRHAPPSPELNFAPMRCQAATPFSLSSLEEMSSEALGSEDCPENLAPLHVGFVDAFPEDVLSAILTCIADVRLLPIISLVARGFQEAMKCPEVWRDRAVGLYLGTSSSLAPQLASWCTSWRHARKIVLPRSRQLVDAISRRLPSVELEFAWRFNETIKGAGVEVLNHGRTVRRLGTEHLVVLGDAPLVADATGAGQYLEVVLDRRGEMLGDGLNDFGIGFTACDPELMLQNDWDVADDIPRSWVVDFTKLSVVLNVNNYVAACGTQISADTLMEGDRVGVRLAPDGCVEVFLNSVLRQRLVPPVKDKVPTGTALYPILDLYGRATQITRTEKTSP